MLRLSTIKAGSTLFADIAEMQKQAEDTHKELLELIANISEGTASDKSSSVCKFFSSMGKS